MELFLLYFDACFNLAVLILGVVSIFRAQDNNIRLWWGIIMVLLGVVLLYGSADWIYRYNQGGSAYSDCHYGLLRFSPMVKGFIVTVCLSLFSLAALHPAYLTRIKLVVFFIPVLALVIIVICYYLFNGYFTEIHTIQDIVSNISNLDVKVRLFVAVIMLITVPVYFFMPILGDWTSTWRRATPLYYLFLYTMFFMLGYFIAYTLVENRFIFYSASMANTIPCIIFSIYFLLHENPFSYRLAIADKEEEAEDEAALDKMLYNNMQVYFECNLSFTKQGYTLRDLANEMHTSQVMIVRAIKSGGFIGFHEYINFLKIQYFKTLAKAEPGRTVKELMNLCGFSSRSTFYRIFSEFENTTPSEFMAKLTVN